MDKIETAIEHLRTGKMIVVVDDENRENEGDLITAAELITPAQINFMITHGRGLVCLALPAARIDHLQLSLLKSSKKNQDSFSTAFTESIDAKEGVTTGISAFDRAQTIRQAMQKNASGHDFVVPGHMFPLRAQPGGVLTRRGHTEAAVDLTSLAGLEPGGVICELLNADGSMMRLPQLEIFAKQHQLPLISIEDLVKFRLSFSSMNAHATIPTAWGDYFVRVFSDEQGREHLVLWRGELSLVESPLVRIHSECLTGDVFGSKKCDCGQQLEHSMRQIANEKAGMIIYLRQEGRGIGLSEKIKAYALQEKGFDTVEANQLLGHPADGRSYGIVVKILEEFGINSVRLLSNNPLKIESLRSANIACSRISLAIPSHPENHFYLQTKIQKLGHISDGFSHKLP